MSQLCWECASSLADGIMDENKIPAPNPTQNKSALCEAQLVISSQAPVHSLSSATRKYTP